MANFSAANIHVVAVASEGVEYSGLLNVAEASGSTTQPGVVQIYRVAPVNEEVNWGKLLDIVKASRARSIPNASSPAPVSSIVGIGAVAKSRWLVRSREPRLPVDAMAKQTLATRAWLGPRR